MLKFFRIQYPFYDDEGLAGAGAGGDVGSTGAGDVGAGDPTIAAIQSSIAGLEGAESKTTEETQPKRTSEEDAEEAEIESIRKELREKNTKLVGKLDVDRHQAVVTRIRRQHEAAVKKAQEEHEAALKEYEWAKDPEMRAALEAMQLADADPEKFIQALMSDQRYQNLIQLKQAQAEAQRQEQSQDGSMPPPDKQTEDGYAYYSEAGIKKLMEWNASQAETRALEKFRKEFGPVKDAYTQSANWNASLQRSRDRLENARKSWDGFAENEESIAKLMLEKGNERMSLEEAHRIVVTKALREKANINEAEMRKRLLEEMKTRPAAVGEVPGRGVERKAENYGRRDTEDIIRDSIRNYKGGE